MNADDINPDFRLTYVPARQKQRAHRPVFTFNLTYPRWVGFGRGKFFHPRPGQALSVPVGTIPEVEHTFGYYEAAEPLMNDQGLGLGESSCAAMLVNRLPGKTGGSPASAVGILDTATLMQLTLERCSSALCAVQLIGNLSETYGFVPTPGESTIGTARGRRAWDDTGEAFTIADAAGNAWVVHVLGGVHGITKSVWAARKVPRGHFAVVANEFTIGELPPEPHEEFLFNREIFRVALAAKLWDGKGSLHFARTFAPDPMAFEAPAGTTPVPLYASLRRWGLMNLAAPSMRLQFKVRNLEYPFSVKVEKALSHRDVMGFLRYYYQGTEFDMSQGILAGMFGTPFRLEGGPATGQIPRGISIMRTAYSIIVHTGPQRQLAWFAMDTPLTSVYVPLYRRSTAVSHLYSAGHNANFTRESAWWAFDFVNNFMQLRYRDMSQDVYPAIEKWQDAIDSERASMERVGADDLGKWQESLQMKLVADWWSLAELLIVKYNDGYLNIPVIGQKAGYPAWYADMVGFSNDVHPVWVQPAAKPPLSVSGYVAPEFQLPLHWDSSTYTWSDPPSPSSGLGWTSVVLASFLALCVGAVAGRMYERWQQGAKRNQTDGFVRLA